LTCCGEFSTHMRTVQKCSIAILATMASWMLMSKASNLLLAAPCIPTYSTHSNTPYPRPSRIGKIGDNLMLDADVAASVLGPRWRMWHRKRWHCSHNECLDAWSTHLRPLHMALDWTGRIARSELDYTLSRATRRALCNAATLFPLGQDTSTTIRHVFNSDRGMGPIGEVHFRRGRS
jgi:hypothetical protein